MPQGDETNHTESKIGSAPKAEPGSKKFSILQQIRDNLLSKSWLQYAFELILLALAAVWLGRDYFPLDSRMWPPGAEYPWVIQTHHFWTWIQQCGLCALWNGASQGGYPALVDLQGASLHPVIMLTTLLFGVVNGGKVAVLIAFWLAGVGQWLLAHQLKLGWAPRLWTALLAVLGTHLAGKMELGWMQVILAAGSASLVFAPLIALARQPRPRNAVWLAVTLALTLLAGQGYIQIGLLAVWMASLVMFWGKSQRQAIKMLLLSGGMALLLAGPLIIPVLHFLPNFTKETDPLFRGGQPLYYLVLNFLISDRKFHLSTLLSKPASPAHTALYIGWLPLALALGTFWSARKEDLRELVFLGSSTILVLFLASGGWIRLLTGFLPEISGLRNPMLIAPLAVPPLLGLAGYTLSKLFANLLPGTEATRYPAWQGAALGLLIGLMAWNLVTVYNSSRQYMATTRADPKVEAVLEQMRTPSLQWVEPPPQQWGYLEIGARLNMKFNLGHLPWSWKNQDYPSPYYAAEDLSLEPPENGIFVTELRGLAIYRFDDIRDYATIQSGGEVFTCPAYGTGGDLSVTCNTPASGVLVLREHQYPGWLVWRDGEPTPMIDHIWLAVEAPPGEHTYRFRYLPLDALAGILLGVTGWIWAIVWLARDRRTR